MDINGVGQVYYFWVTTFELSLKVAEKGREIREIERRREGGRKEREEGRVRNLE